MLKSTPKSSSIIAICFFIIGILAVDIWIFLGLIKHPSSYFLVKLILVPTLLVIAILVAVKGYSSAIAISFGHNKISYRYPFSTTKEYPIKDIVDWHEDVITRKDSKYKRLTIQLVNSKKLHLSNQENSNYDNIVKYLKKKIKKSR